MKKTCNHLTDIREKVCWKIIKPDLSDKPTESKYCQWKERPELIRRFDILGFMTPSTNDAMITKYCAKCNQMVLLKIKEDVCAFCRQVY